MLDCSDLTLTHTDTKTHTDTCTDTDTLSITCWRKQFFKLCDNHLLFNRIACSMWQLEGGKGDSTWFIVAKSICAFYCLPLCGIARCIYVYVCVCACEYACVCVLICVPFAQTEIENEISLQLRCLICLIGSPQLHI